MSSAIKKYAFINAKLRARISKNIPDEIFQEMINAKSFLETIEFLRDTPYSDVYNVYNETGDLLSAEKEILKKETSLFTDLLKYVDPGIHEYIKALALRYEINNLKNCIRLFFDRSIRGRDTSLQTAYLIHEKIVHRMNCDRIINAASLEELVEFLKNTPYYKVVKSSMVKVEKVSSVFPVEIALDKYYYDNVFNQISLCLSKNDKQIALKVFYLDIDVENIDRIVRFKHFYALDADTALQYIIPYGIVPSNIDAFKKLYEKEDVSDFISTLMDKSDKSFKSMFDGEIRDRSSRLLLIERITEQILLYEARKILFAPPFSVGIILTYFILKQFELKKIMTILNAKNYNYQPERISTLL
jgi:V/A-type H+/Na+-transporting ATPase subunit C